MATKYNRSMRLPKDNYVVRCVEESFANSKSSGNPMITLEFEVQLPDEVDIAGEKVTVAGLSIKHYLTTMNLQDSEKSANALKRLIGDGNKKGIYQLFGLPTDNFNPENPVLGFKGKLVHVRIGVDEQASRKDPTPEQVKKGELGDIIKNPVTKEPVLFYPPKIEEIYGLAEEGAGKSF